MTMETPRSTQGTQPTHVRTPKLSSRKKSLFGKDDSNESDLGMITPLRFGGNRSNTKSNTTLHNITSFRNLFGNESPDSERSLSPDFAQRYTNNGRYELLTEGNDKENQHGVDEETRFSFHSIPATPNGRPGAETSALIDESNSNSLSLQMSSDLNLIEKRSQPTLRTPSLRAKAAPAEPSQVRSHGASYRRMHGEGKSASVATPDGNDPEPHRIAPRPTVKARTALHFSEMQPISTKSFYSSSVSDNPYRTEQNPIAHPPAVAALVQRPPKGSNSPPKAAKSNGTAKTPRKSSSMRKRSKSFSSSAPRLGQRGDVHKIRKPVKKSPPPEAVSRDQRPSRKRSERENTTERSKNKRAIASGTKSCPTTPKTSEQKQPNEDHFIRQLEHVKEILQRNQHRLQRARPLSTSRSMTDLTRATQFSGDEDGTSASEDEEPLEHSEDESQCTQRKFFRSRTGSRTNRKVYKHFNSMSLEVRKGGKRKLIDFPRTPKRRRTDFATEEFDFASEQLEVDDLISRLDQTGGSYSGECSERQEWHGQWPSHTNGYEEMVALVDDDPIPIQSNVIYVTMDDFGVDETQMDGLTGYEESEQGSQTIIVHYDNPETAPPIANSDENLLSAMSMDSAKEGFTQDNQPQRFTSDTTISQASTSGSSENAIEYYPLFYRDQAKELWKQERSGSYRDAAQMDVFRALRHRDRTPKPWHGTGHDQYQLDAGQRAYGAVQCPECGLIYSNNEPEEELIHDNFHRSQAQLTFTGWVNEHVVSTMPEWDVTGRIIVVSQADSRHWLAKVRTILEVVDSELGFATHGVLPESACVYLAIARSTVLGVCVVQPLQYANRMVSIEGLHGTAIDCYSSEYYPTKCGISRIWVSPKFRRLGVGRALMLTIKKHYIFGHEMQSDEIAFGAPTDSGKLFAEAVTGRNDFLVYL